MSEVVEVSEANEVSVIDDKTTAALETMDSGSREIAITEMLERAQSYLAVAMQQPDAPRAVADFKAEIIAVAQYAKQKRVSEEIQIDATAMVRRAERSLGVAIREGQESGGVETLPEARSRAAIMRDIKLGRSDHKVENIVIKNRPDDYAKPDELRGNNAGIYHMTDDVSDTEFETALDTAKEERNLSRANVVRKIKDAKGDPTIDQPNGEKGMTPTEQRRRKAGPKRDHILTLEKISLGVDSYAMILAEILEDGLDKSVTNEKAATLNGDLSRSIRTFNQLKQALKNRKDS